MIIAIHQPNYLPWLGYFYKIANCDTFVFLDNVQYSKGGFVNRNRIKTPQGASWLTVDVLTKSHYGQLIQDVEINNTILWRNTHRKSLEQNYSKTPYFKEYFSYLDAVSNMAWVKLSKLNIALIKTICHNLGIDNVRFVLASELGVTGESTQLLLNICQEVGANTYLSGPSGHEYMDESLFSTTGIGLKYTDFKHPVYTQRHGNFIPNMSIVDLLFNEGEKSLEILNGSR